MTHQERWFPAGANWVFAIGEAKQGEVVILNLGADTTLQEGVVQDVLEILTVFSTRLSGSGSRQNQKQWDGMKRAVEEPTS